MKKCDYYLQTWFLILIFCGNLVLRYIIYFFNQHKLFHLVDIQYDPYFEEINLTLPRAIYMYSFFYT